jgi:hypothetical protein
MQSASSWRISELQSNAIMQIQLNSKMDKVMGEKILSLPILNSPHFDIILLPSSPFRPP